MLLKSLCFARAGEMEVQWLLHDTVGSVLSSTSCRVHHRCCHLSESRSFPWHTCHVCLFIQFSVCRPFAFTVHVTVQIRKMKTTISASVGKKKNPWDVKLSPVSVSHFKSLNPRLRQSNPICSPRISICLFFFFFRASPHRSPDLKQNVFHTELDSSNNESFKFPLWGRSGSWDEKKVWKPTRCDCLWWNSSLLLLLALWPPA